MGKSKKLEAAMAEKSAIHADIRATSIMLARLLPQFIEDNDDLETLIGYISDFRAGIAHEKPARETLIIIDSFLSELRGVLPESGSE